MEQNEIEQKLGEIKKLAARMGVDAGAELEKLEAKIKAGSDAGKVWRHVELARHPMRPYAMDYIVRVFNGWTELRGDRYFGDDPAIIGGLAFAGKRPVTVIAHQKGRTLKENLFRNHGMANPEGYRKALRLARQAEKFRRPVITFVDTAGAYPGLGSEERGIGEAIARNLFELSRLQTPVICFIIGEGGSGGALGLCVGDKVYMLENAIYSVISPEGGASILLRDSARAKDAAAMLRLTSADLLRFKLINGVINEPEGGAHMDIDGVARQIKAVIDRELDELCARPIQAIVRYRNKKISKMGQWQDAPLNTGAKDAL
ncbi:MAG: acetyl-CoA carboxylase carboxyltransferase subunit alpha [Spirochaetaceae bacterium]|jgi:acetyl-CoA carboxylase carboxyl transferase subunit alpha|nr:acetyl-CoA carboxylase carboxyltransferase subunit alpha [Spirochaetaceae bacterium]